MLNNYQRSAADQLILSEDVAGVLVSLSQHFDPAASLLTPELPTGITSPTPSHTVSFPALPSGKVKSDDGHPEHSRAPSPTPSQTSNAALSMSYAKVAGIKSPIMGPTNLAGPVDKGKARATSADTVEAGKKSQVVNSATNGTGDDWKVGPEGVWGDKGILGNKGG